MYIREERIVNKRNEKRQHLVTAKQYMFQAVLSGLYNVNIKQVKKGKQGKIYSSVPVCDTGFTTQMTFLYLSMSVYLS